MHHEQAPLLPRFETERLLLVPRTMAHFDDCLAMDRDPDVVKFIPGPWNDPPSHRAFLKTRIEADFGKGLGYWSIFPKQRPDAFAGWILLIPHDGIGPDAEIGWRLNRSTWGKGYATEAAQMIVRHAFLTLGAERIIAEINPDNVSSRRVAEKLGMARFDIRRQAPAPDLIYAMTRAGFSG